MMRNAIVEVGGGNPLPVVLDKEGFGKRWGLCRRTIENLMRGGLPHLKIGSRRVRIVVADADAWMRRQYGIQRHGPLNA